MPGREFQATPYRFGFNGKENDHDVKGFGNQQDYGARIYDGRLGRFLSVDPLTKEYPWYTPYQFSGNKPIRFNDRDGEEESDPFFVQEKRGKKGDKLASSADISAIFTLGLVYGPHEAQAYHFSRMAGGKLTFSNRGYSFEAKVVLSSDSYLYSAIFSAIEKVHHLPRNSFTEEQRLEIVTYTFKLGVDNSDLFYYEDVNTKFAQITPAIPLSGRPPAATPGVSIGVNSLYLIPKVLALDKVNLPLVLNAVSKSQQEYDKHIADQEKGKQRLEKLQEQLSKTKKNSKERREIQDKISNEKELLKGHEKEIKQKWPDGRPE